MIRPSILPRRKGNSFKDTFSSGIFADYVKLGANPWTISNGQLQANGTSVESILAMDTIKTLNHTVEAEISAYSSTGGILAVRVQDIGNFYMLQYAAPALAIYRVIAGGYTAIATINVTIPFPCTLSLRIVNGTLAAFLNNNKVLEVNDTGITQAGYVGLRCFQGTMSIASIRGEYL